MQGKKNRQIFVSDKFQPKRGKARGARPVHSASCSIPYSRAPVRIAPGRKLPSLLSRTARVPQRSEAQPGTAPAPLGSPARVAPVPHRLCRTRPAAGHAGAQVASSPPRLFRFMAPGVAPSGDLSAGTTGVPAVQGVPGRGCPSLTSLKRGAEPRPAPHILRAREPTPLGGLGGSVVLFLLRLSTPFLIPSPPRTEFHRPPAGPSRRPGPAPPRPAPLRRAVSSLGQTPRGRSRPRAQESVRNSPAGPHRPAGRETRGRDAAAGLQPSLTWSRRHPAFRARRCWYDPAGSEHGSCASRGAGGSSLPARSSVLLASRIGTERLWPKAAPRMLPPFSLLEDSKSCLRKHLEEALPFSHYTKVCFCRGRPGGCSDSPAAPPGEAAARWGEERARLRSAGQKPELAHGVR